MEGSNLAVIFIVNGDAVLRSNVKVASLNVSLYCSWVPTDLESQGINLVGEKSGNFVGGQGKMMCIARVVRLLFILSKK